MVTQDVIFGNGQIEIQNIEELSLDSANITFPENTSANSPVYIFECGII
jgi:hypothetical protein